MPRIRLDQVTRFRRRLVESLAFEAQFSWLLGSFASPDTARDLGVRDEVLAEAAEMRRRGFRMPLTQTERNESSCPGRARLRVAVWKSIAERVLGAAARRHETPAGMMRSLMHAMMRTTFEPVSPVPRLTQKPESKVYIQSFITVGLYQAICRRAAARGLSRTRYVNLWLTDYVSGCLPPAKVRTVTRGECFDDAELYVLPVFDEGGADVTKSA